MIHVIVCGYHPENLERCRASIHMQSVKDKIVYVSLDTDENRKYLLKNTWDVIRMINANDNDILVFVDADDFLIDEEALQIILEVYKENSSCLLTYGSYVTLSNNKRGKFCGEYDVIDDVRRGAWRGSHLKTCKYKLWKKLSVSDLTWPDGEFFKCCADRATMIPMMEIAGFDRIVYVDKLLYCYDDSNPCSVWNTMREESIRTRDFIIGRPSYARAQIL